MEPSTAQQTAELFGDLWHRYDDAAFKHSVELFTHRWADNGEDPTFFRGKRCLDVGCGGGRYTLAMALMGAQEAVGIDLSAPGLRDAEARVARVGSTAVRFVQGSALELPFDANTFDFVCCSGVLHHTPNIELGLREIHRVLKPGGRAYFLLYGAGGLYWPLHLMMRPMAQALGRDEVQRCLEAAQFTAAKQRTVLDDLFVPMLETYTHERIDQLVQSAGFAPRQRWSAGHRDHESSPASMLAEIQLRTTLWECGHVASAPAQRPILESLASLCRTTWVAGHTFVSQHQAGVLDRAALRAGIIGLGHHRFIVTKPTQH